MNIKIGSCSLDIRVYEQLPRVQAWAVCDSFVLVAAMNPCPPGYYGYYGDYGDMGSNALIRCRTIAPDFVCYSLIGDRQ